MSTGKIKSWSGPTRIGRYRQGHFITDSREAVDEAMRTAAAAGGTVVKAAAARRGGYFGGAATR
jgi:hypothetical protein